jgi:YegS/Rv2252/BmrU family lipid kinase
MMGEANRKRLHVIVNPVSGLTRDDEEAIRAFLDARDDAGYQLSLTQDAGDATRFAQAAVKDNADLVIVCGGDGTVVEAAAGLADSGVPLAIIPSGTANVLAEELGVPPDRQAALELALAEDHVIRPIDMGCIDDKHFLIAVAMGYAADVSGGTPREEKARLGKLAYFVHAVRQLRHSRLVRYRLTLDGETVTAEGMTLVIFNARKFGVGRLQLADNIAIDDGSFNVVVIRTFSPFRFVLNAITSRMNRPLPEPPLQQWRASTIDIQTSRRQMIAYDGEALRKDRQASVRLLPKAVSIIVPPETG